MSGLWLVSYVALWLLFLLTAFALVSVLRNMGELAEAVKQIGGTGQSILLKQGEIAPEIPLHTIHDQPFSTATLRNQATTFATISPGCGPCHELLHALAHGVEPDEFRARDGRRILVSTGTSQETISALSEVTLPSDITVLIDTQHAVAEAWGARSTPTFIMLDAKGHYVKHAVGFTPPAPLAAAAPALVPGQPQPH